MAFISNKKDDKVFKTQSQWNMKESSLHIPVKEWLEGKGFRCFSEVPYPTSFSFIDVVGMKDHDIICVELKASLNQKAIHQAYHSQLITPNVYVAVGTIPSKKSIEKCIRFGIGVISIKDNTVSIILEPTKRTDPWKPFVESIIDTLSNGGFEGVAGLPNMKGTGPAQKVLESVEEALLKDPKISWKTLFDTIPNHYSNHKSMQQAINKARERKLK